MNRELRDVLQISTKHHGPSHMWTAETLCEYLDFLAIELRRKRKKHGLTASAKALVLMDKAPQHSSSTFKKVRERFERDHNVVLVHGESIHQVAIPAGLGLLKETFIHIHAYIYMHERLIYLCWKKFIFYLQSHYIFPFC